MKSGVQESFVNGGMVSAMVGLIFLEDSSDNFVVILNNCVILINSVLLGCSHFEERCDFE